MGGESVRGGGSSWHCSEHLPVCVCGGGGGGGVSNTQDRDRVTHLHGVGEVQDEDDLIL